MQEFATNDAIPAYCPEIDFLLRESAEQRAGREAIEATGQKVTRATGSLQQGRDYDMVVSESVSKSVEITTHPIEDLTSSFVNDHTRQNPTEISLTMLVSTIPCAIGAVSGIDRLRRVQDSLEALMARQSVAADAFLKIYTGVRTYENMGIRSLDFSREPEAPNTMQIDIGLIEFRVAQSPTFNNEKALMDANDGYTDARNQPVVSKLDFRTTAATKVRRAPRMAYPLPSQEQIIRRALLALGDDRLKALDLIPSTATVAGRL